MTFGKLLNFFCALYHHILKRKGRNNTYVVGWLWWVCVLQIVESNDNAHFHPSFPSLVLPWPQSIVPLYIKDHPNGVYLEITCIIFPFFLSFKFVFLNERAFKFLIRMIVLHSCSRLCVWFLIFHLHRAQYVGGIKGHWGESSIILTTFMSLLLVMVIIGKAA